MRLRSALEISLVPLILSGAGAQALAAGSPIPVFLLALAVFHQTYRGWEPALGTRGVNLAATVLLAATIGSLFAGIHIFGVLGYLILGLLAIRIYQSWVVDGVWRILLLCFMQIVLSGARTTRGAFILPYVAFLVSTVCVLTLYRLWKDHGDESRVRLPRGFALRLGGTSVLILVLSLAIFFAIPRVSAGWVSHWQGAAGAMVGFGDEVDMDRYGQILDNPEVVMRVEGPEIDGDPHLWKGRVFAEYDGRRWKAAPSATNPFRSGVGWRDFVRRPARRDGIRRKGTFQIFTLRPVSRGALFTPVGTTKLWFKSSPPGSVKTDDGGGVSTPHAARGDVQYTANYFIPYLKRPPDPSEEELQHTRRYWRSIDPQAVDVARLKELADRLVEESGAGTAYERAIAIERHLKDEGEFAYTLATPEIHPEARERVEDFLFYGKRGHCEYFAAAMVLLCRTQGIPARLVNGFKEGEWNPFGHFRLVRQRHAHAWVEVYMGADFGWLPLDPTPSAAGMDLGSAFASVGAFLQYVKYLWVTKVVTFNIQDQIDALRKARQATLSLAEELKGLVPEISGKGLARLAPVAVLILVAAAGLGMLRGPGARAASAAVPTCAFYRDLHRLLARRGWPREPGETPLELAARVVKHGGEAWADALPITEAYYRVRYGGETLAPAEEADLAARVRALREATRPAVIGAGRAGGA